MTNEEMHPGRFQRWAQYRKMFSQIQSCLADGGVVQVCTYTKATEYAPKHADCFKVTREGVFAKQGNHFVCISHCRIRYGRLVSQ